MAKKRSIVTNSETESSTKGTEVQINGNKIFAPLKKKVAGMKNKL